MFAFVLNIFDCINYLKHMNCPQYFMPPGNQLLYVCTYMHIASFSVKLLVNARYQRTRFIICLCVNNTSL